MTISFWIKKKGAWTGTGQLVKILGAIYITALDAGGGTGDITAKIIDDQGTSVTFPFTFTPWGCEAVGRAVGHCSLYNGESEFTWSTHGDHLWVSLTGITHGDHSRGSLMGFTHRFH